MTTRIAALLLWLAVSLSANQPTAKLTEEQAIQRARQFCAKIGQPVTLAAVATFPAGRVSNWSPCWEVDFAPDATVWVVDATGDVLRYFNPSYRKRPEMDGPAGEAIPEKDARRIADAVMEASGGGHEFALRGAWCRQESSRQVRGMHKWLLEWNRRAGNLIYERTHGASITLDAEDGTVVGFGKRTPSPPLPSVEVRLTKDDALKATGRALDAMHVTAGDVLDAKTLIVQPNALWQGAAPERATTTSAEGDREPLSCAAWVIRFANPDRKSYWREVWIDAVTGKVVGGAQGGLK